MSDQALATPPQEALHGVKELPAGRLPGDTETFRLVCHIIANDGVTGDEAALLAGEDLEWLQLWLELYPETRRNLDKARAIYRRELFRLIKTADRKDGPGWRCLV